MPAVLGVWDRSAGAALPNSPLREAPCLVSAMESNYGICSQQHMQNVLTIVEADSTEFFLCDETWNIQTRVTNAVGTTAWVTSPIVYVAPPCLQ